MPAPHHEGKGVRQTLGDCLRQVREPVPILIGMFFEPLETEPRANQRIHDRAERPLALVLLGLLRACGNILLGDVLGWPALIDNNASDSLLAVD